MADEHDEWDMDYYTEVHWSKIPQDTAQITAIGHGRGKLATDISKLSLPKKAFAGNISEGADKGRPGRGKSRGRGEEMKARALMKTGPARIPREQPGRRSTELTSFTSFPPLSTSRMTEKSPQSSPSFSKKFKNSSKSNKNTESDMSWPSLHSASSTSSKKISSQEKSQTSQTFADRCRPGNSQGMSSIEGLDESDGDDIIVIHNLPKTTQEKDLVELLQLYGTVLVCDIEKDCQGESIGRALVRMENSTECDWIISCFHDQEYPGSSERLIITRILGD